MMEEFGEKLNRSIVNAWHLAILMQLCLAVPQLNSLNDALIPYPSKNTLRATSAASAGLTSL